MPESPQVGKGRYTRRSLRLPFHLGVGVLIRMSGHEPRRLEGMVQNLSAGGLMVELPVPLTPGRAIDLEARTQAGDVCSVTAIVVWNRPHREIVRHGVRFSQPWGGEAVDQLFWSRFGSSG